MYAIVKTGGKQYKVSPGDILSIEKLDAEVGEEVELPVICVVDGENIEADPEKAAGTVVTALVIDQYKGKKQLVFKFKKRKGYKKLRGHRQQLTKVQIIAVGGEVFPEEKRVWLTRPEKVEAVEEAEAEVAAEVAEEVEEKTIEEIAEEISEAAEEVEEEAAEAVETAEAAEEVAEEAAEKADEE